MTPAERMREAARVLREPWTTPAPWWCSSDLAVPVADWLEETAAHFYGGIQCSPAHPAMRVADAVLGEP